MVTLRKGKGAICKARIRFLHPAIDVAEKYPKHSYTNGQFLEGLKVFGRGMMKVKKLQQCIVMQHEAFGDKNIHCVEKYAVMTNGLD